MTLLPAAPRPAPGQPARWYPRGEWQGRCRRRLPSPPREARNAPRSGPPAAASTRRAAGRRTAWRRAPPPRPPGGATGAGSVRRRRNRWRRVSRRGSRFAAHHREEDGFLGVEAVLCLIEDPAARVINGLLDGFLAVVGGQVVHEDASGAQVIEPLGRHRGTPARLAASASAWGGS